MVGTPAANPAFNGTFTGSVMVNTPGGAVADTITMTLAVGSPLDGTILFDVLGFVGTIQGDASGDQAMFTITGPCPGLLEGSMIIVVTVDGTTIDIDASGSDCDGALDFSGTADELEDCDDRQDNDGDDLIDCDDPDCDKDPACVKPVCGDGSIDGTEECDDSNTTACDGCSDTCQDETGLVCGDNILNQVCGANFAGGSGCEQGSSEFCSLPTFSSNYEVTPGNTVTINLSGDLTSLEVLFVSQLGDSGQMTFFDAPDLQGVVVDTLMTNGTCFTATAALATQMISFGTPVRSIKVEPLGNSVVFMDFFNVNP